MVQEGPGGEWGGVRKPGGEHRKEKVEVGKGPKVAGWGGRMEQDPPQVYGSCFKYRPPNI
jgi:hypothetical protein